MGSDRHEIASQHQWNLEVAPDMVLDILRDVEALPDLTRPYLPSWNAVDVNTTVVERDRDGAPSLVRTTTSWFGLRDSMMSRYSWTPNGCSWQMVSSQLLKSAGGRIEIAMIRTGTRLAVQSYAIAKPARLIGPLLNPLFRQAEKLGQLGIEALPAIIVDEAARRASSAEA